MNSTEIRLRSSTKYGECVLHTMPMGEFSVATSIKFLSIRRCLCGCW